MSTDQFRSWMAERGFERAELGPNVPAELAGKMAFRMPIVANIEKAASDDGDEKELRLRVTMTTPTADRDGDVILPKGINLKWFKKNPVVLWCHDYKQPPIGNVDVKTFNVTDKGIDADIVFDAADPAAVFVYGKYERKIMRAFSIGFVPIQWDVIEDKKTGRVTGYRVTKSELWELSAVPVPSNPEALRRDISDMESKGYDPKLLPFVSSLKAALPPAVDAEGATEDEPGSDTDKSADEPDAPTVDAEPGKPETKTIEDLAADVGDLTEVVGELDVTSRATVGACVHKLEDVHVQLTEATNRLKALEDAEAERKQLAIRDAQAKATEDHAEAIASAVMKLVPGAINGAVDAALHKIVGGV